MGVDGSKAMLHTKRLSLQLPNKSWEKVQDPHCVVVWLPEPHIYPAATISRKLTPSKLLSNSMVYGPAQIVVDSDFAEVEDEIYDHERIRVAHPGFYL